MLPIKWRHIFTQRTCIACVERRQKFIVYFIYFFYYCSIIYFSVCFIWCRIQIHSSCFSSFNNPQALVSGMSLTAIYVIACVYYDFNWPKNWINIRFAPTNIIFFSKLMKCLIVILSHWFISATHIYIRVIAVVMDIRFVANKCGTTRKVERIGKEKFSTSAAATPPPPPQKCRFMCNWMRAEDDCEKKKSVGTDWCLANVLLLWMTESSRKIMQTENCVAEYVLCAIHK